MKFNLVNPEIRSDYLSNVLRARGIENVEEYINPPASYLQSPSDLHNIGMAAALYLRIMGLESPHILIVVDSDNDGYTSAAIIYQYSARLNPNAKIDYVLHEGKQHGLQDHIDNLMQNNIQYDLIILPDSSSNDAHYHDMLDEIHIPCLILDHHLTDTELSDNAIVVNNQLSPDYNNKELTGAGVVYQFCRYIDAKLGHSWANDYIDLAAWGIVGDMGSMIEMENRYIVCEGFRNIKNPLFKAILTKQAYSITGEMGATWDTIVEKTNPISVAFYVVPLVNALIRVGAMPEKDLLFRAFVNGASMIPSQKRGAHGELDTIANEATRICSNAKNKQTKLKEDAVEKLEMKIFKNDLLDNKVLIVKLDETDRFPSELNGLIAMQLAAKYKMPTIVARLNSEGYVRGSARGLNQSELRDFREFLLDSKFVEYAQGHANAFGVSIRDDSIDAFNKYANEALRDYNFGENLYDVNFIRNANEPDIADIVMDINRISGIWGQNNSEPSIAVTSIPLDKALTQVMGASKDTLKITYNGISYMKFKAKDMIDQLQKRKDGYNLNIVGRTNINRWGGREIPQIFIDDYDFSNPDLEF